MVGVLVVSGTAGASVPLPARPVVAALAYANTWMLKPFPRLPGQTECRIPAGGPMSAGPGVPGICATFVRRGRTFVTVAFVETWQTSVFRSQDATTPTESHTWLFVEPPNLHVLDETTYGDVPPQWVR